MDQSDRAPPGYEILEELGQGTTGIVYKAWQRALNLVVALKMPVFTSDADKPLQIARFLNEAQVLARLTSEPDAFFPTLYEVGSYREQPYYARQFVEGDTLERLAKAGALGLREGIAALASVAKALHRAHCKGIVHRNLDPTNVLLTTDGTTKLIGFGRARSLIGSEVVRPGTISASCNVDLHAMDRMLNWFRSVFKQGFPPALEAILRASPLSSAAVFEEALLVWLEQSG